MRQPLTESPTRTLVRRVRDELLATPDTVCLERARLVTEAHRLWGHLPAPLWRAKSLAFILQNMTLDLDSNPFFAGNTSSRPRAWMLVPEHGLGIDAQVLIENDGLEHLLDGAVPEEIVSYWQDRASGGLCNIGHLAVDLDAVVHRGLEALIVETESYEEDADEARRTYRQAMAISLRAVIDWAGRYALAAQEASEAASDPLLRQLHLRVAGACRQVPAKPARDLFEALQAIVLVHLALAIEGHGMSVSIGLPDRVLARFAPDSAEQEPTADLLAAFMLKITANAIFGRASKTQPITVGGADDRGVDQCNSLTSCFLAACDLVRVGDPHLFVRWHPQLDPEVWQRATEMLAQGVSMPLLISDPATAQGFQEAGVSPEDAWEYCVIGCNELGIPGRSAQSATATDGSVPYLQALNEVIDSAEDLGQMETMQPLLERLELTLAQRLTEMRKRGIANVRRAAEKIPTPFTSSLMRGCIARGLDMRVGMDYHLPGLYERGLSNAANALAAIEHTVFDEHSLTLAQIRESMASDHADEQVRARLLSAPRWGNDDARADHWAVALVAMRERILDQLDGELATPQHVVCHVVRSLHRLDGQSIGASADGRRAHQPLVDSIGAENGGAEAGPTATLNSVLKLDAPRHYRGGYNLNVTLSRATATPQSISSLAQGFFRQGGQELQVNCLDAALLRQARACPQEHGDLLVRIAGFSARFVDLSRAEQDELITRAEGIA